MTKDVLPFGKLDPKILQQIVFTRLGSPSPRVIIGPKIGEDAALIDFDEKVLVVHSDPITGAIENIGWLAVNICANDIATKGVRPLWVLVVMILPQRIRVSQLKHITGQINEAAKELGIAVIGGHSEVTPGISRPIIVVTALGEVEKSKYVSSSGAVVGDSVILTKGAAIEGTAILSTELKKTLEAKVNKSVLLKAQKFIEMISVVEDALTAIEVGGVHAMHDATEGGVAGALQEIAWASNVGVRAYEKKIPIYKEAKTICEALNIDPLKTMSSGALLISADSKKAQEIIAALKEKGIQASVIGKVVEKKGGAYLIRSDGTKLDLSEPIREELWIGLERHITERE